MAKKRKSYAPLENGPGSLTLPHGQDSWHFKHLGVEGNGFNGQIRHLWKPEAPNLVPGKGIINHNG